MFGIARRKTFCNVGADFKACLNVFVDTLVDDFPKFLIVERRTIFFDQAAKFIKQEIVALDLIVEVREDFFEIHDVFLKRTSPRAGSMLSICTPIVCPGCSFCGDESLGTQVVILEFDAAFAIKGRGTEFLIFLVP